MFPRVFHNICVKFLTYTSHHETIHCNLLSKRSTYQKQILNNPVAVDSTNSSLKPTSYKKIRNSPRMCVSHSPSKLINSSVLTMKMENRKVAKKKYKTQ